MITQHEVRSIANSVLSPSISIVCLSNNRLTQARAFSETHRLPLKKRRDDDAELQLIFHADIIELNDSDTGSSISVDFLSGTLAHRQRYGGGRGQAIAKAIGLRSGNTPAILDATAGLASDAFVLATLGCPVLMLERSAILSLLIEDAIERASLNQRFTTIENQGFSILNQDSNEYIEAHRNDENRPDVIYIDPMYPERKKSALVKKEMQILQRLHGHDENAGDLLENALSFARKRVVVKRPIHADNLTDRKPNTCIKSKKTRFDVYTLEKM